VTFDFDACLRDQASVPSSGYVRARYNSGLGMVRVGDVDNAHLLGAIALLTAGSFLWGSHAFLRLLHQRTRRDYSLPRRIYVTAALILFALATACTLPVGIVLAVVSLARQPTVFADVSSGYWLAAGLASAVFTTRFLLSARSLGMQPALPRLKGGTQGAAIP
jgi:hypothetical protein